VRLAINRERNAMKIKSKVKAGSRGCPTTPIYI
jgi:hypothetical protein